VPEDAKTTPRDVLRALFRRWRVFVPASLVSMILVLVAANWAPLKYTGETILRRRLEVVADATAGGKSESFESYRLALPRDLAGYPAVKKAVEKLGLEKGLPRGSDGTLTLAGKIAKDELVRKLMKGIKVEPDVESEAMDLISVKFTDTDPVLAKQIPDVLVKNYIDRTSQQIIERLSIQRGFFDEKVKGTATELTRLDTKKVQFEIEHADMMPDNPGMFQERIQQIGTDIDTLRRQGAIAKSKRATVEAYIASLRQAATQPATQATTQPATQPATQPTTQPATQPGPTPQPTQVARGPNPKLRRLEDRLQAYKDRLDNALTFQRMTKKHPTVIQLRQKIAQLEKDIEKTPKEVELHRVYDTNPRREWMAQRRGLLLQLASARTEVEVNANELERLQERLSSLQRLAGNFAPIRLEYRKIRKKIADKEAEWNQWKSKLSGVQMALAAETAKRRTHLEAVQAARKQFRPTSPSLWMVLAFAVVGGLGLAGGLVFLTSAMDRSISTSEQAARQFDLPVHGVIGEIVTSRQRTRRRIRRWLLGSLVTMVLTVGLSLSTLNIVLRLRYPEKFGTWKADPAGYVQSHVTEAWERLWRTLE